MSKAVYKGTSYFIYVSRKTAERVEGKEPEMIVGEDAIVLRVVGAVSVSRKSIEVPFSHRLQPKRERTLSAKI